MSTMRRKHPPEFKAKVVLEILKEEKSISELASQLTRQERLELLDWDGAELPLSQQAEVLSLNRSSLYYQPRPPSPEEVAIKHAIERIYTNFRCLAPDASPRSSDGWLSCSLKRSSKNLRHSPTESGCKLCSSFAIAV